MPGSLDAFTERKRRDTPSGKRGFSLSAVPMDFESMWLTVGDIDTHYIVGGEGSPLVLVHGGGGAGAKSDWERNLHTLARRHRVYAPDMIGFGRTDKPRITYTVRTFIQFFDDFMTALGLDRPILLGHSLGGGVVLAYTLNNPDKVDRLILADSAFITEDVGLMGRFLIRLFTLSARLRRDHVYTSLMTSGEASEVLLHRLPEIQVPTLILWGHRDSYLPVRAAYQAHERIKDSRLHIFKRCGHSPHRQRPDEFNTAVLDFLNA